MHFSTCESFKKRPETDLIILPFFIVEGKIAYPNHYDLFKNACDPLIKIGDFLAKENEIAVVYSEKDSSHRVLLLGLGEIDALTSEKLRRAYSQAMKTAWRYKVKKLGVFVPKISGFPTEVMGRGIFEGLLLSNYIFNSLKTEKKEGTHPVQEIVIIEASKQIVEMAKKSLIIAEGVYLARDLANGNADDITPTYLAEVAKGFEKLAKIKTKILDKKALEKEGLRLLLAVGRGSETPPVLIIAEYKGNPKSKDLTVLVGKGVTFDTGGLNLKPTGSMETMKTDMSGGATVLATLLTAARLGIKQNITAVVPSTENGIDGKSFKPGDVYTSHLGKTVEIVNTDAEGRLILADALSYAVKHLKPSRIIDIATLTGAIEIALGNETSGLFSNHDALADMIIRAGSETYERTWRMPLFEEYKDHIRSEIADIKNHGGRSGGAITAAVFIEQFVGQIPWAHLDIAGTGYANEVRRYHGRFATGVGVRLLTEFLEHL